MGAPTFNSILAALALIVSVGLLLVQYRNQLERRHAEIVQMRTQIVSSLASLQQRLASLLINGEIVRLELRRLPESADKYATIERVPRLLSSISELKDQVGQAKQPFEQMNTQKENRSATLLRLQGQAAVLPAILSRADEIEGDMLGLLTHVRKLTEAQQSDANSALKQAGLKNQ